MKARDGAYTRNARFPEPVEHALGSQVNGSRHAQENVDAGVDRLALRPWRENEDVVGSQHARRSGRQREIFLQRFAPAQHRGGHDLHAAFPGLVARREALDVGLVADEEHALERNAADRGACPHEPHGARARRDQAAEAEKIEADDRRARKFAGRLGREAEDERAGEDDVPEMEGAPSMPCRLQEVGQRIFVAHRISGDEHQRDEQSELEEIPDRTFVAVRAPVIEHADRDRADDDRHRIGQPREHPEERPQQGRAPTRQPVRPVEPQRTRVGKRRWPDPMSKSVVLVVAASTHLVRPTLNAAVPFRECRGRKFVSAQVLQERRQRRSRRGQLSLTMFE